MVVKNRDDKEKGKDLVHVSNQPFHFSLNLNASVFREPQPEPQECTRPFVQSLGSGQQRAPQRWVLSSHGLLVSWWLQLGACVFLWCRGWQVKKGAAGRHVGSVYNTSPITMSGQHLRLIGPE